jgi:hypothetical protein
LNRKDDYVFTFLVADRSSGSWLVYCRHLEGLRFFMSRTQEEGLFSTASQPKNQAGRGDTLQSNHAVPLPQLKFGFGIGGHQH